MTGEHSSVALPVRHRSLAVLCYVVTVIGLAGIIWLALTSLQARWVDLSSAKKLLDQIEGRRQPAAMSGESASAPVSGSPFLEGQTVTLAEAALQQRVGSAVKTAGGNVLSSQIEPRGGESKKDFLTLIASCELDQQALQPLLYDLEAGMPFLYVDQLVVQAPQAVGGPEVGRLRVLISVSGRWQGTK